MKRILIDLEKLKDRYVGLGEVSWRFADALSSKAAALKDEGIEIHLLVPPAFVQQWGNVFHYKKTGFIHRHFPATLPGFDLWHSIHQTSGYNPSPSTKNVLLTIHDLNFMYEKKAEKAERYRKRIQQKINRATVLSTISHFSKDEIAKYTDTHQKPVQVIHNGVANPLLEESTRPATNLPASFLFHISSLTPKKNTAALVEMMQFLPEKTLVLAGNWENAYAHKIQQRITELGLKNIIPLHSPSTEEKNWLYINCEAFLFPSLFEGFGLPVIEAFHAGKPVFSSDRTSLKEIGDSYALFWKDFDPQHMAAYIREALPRTMVNAADQQARMAYAARFNWSEVIDQYILLYKKILGV